MTKKQPIQSNQEPKKPALNLLAKYQRNDGLVEDGRWIAYVDETGEETSLEFKIASSDNKEYQKCAAECWRKNADILTNAQAKDAPPETIELFFNKQKEVEFEAAAKHLLKSWRWTDEAGVVHDGELPWGDGVLSFNHENALELLAMKRAKDTFLQYVVEIANNYQNYLASNLVNDIKN